MQRRRSGKKNLGGRPALPTAERLSERVMVNLRPAEKAALRRVCKAHGETEANYLRLLFLRHWARVERRGTRR